MYIKRTFSFSLTPCGKYKPPWVVKTKLPRNPTTQMMVTTHLRGQSNLSVIEQENDSINETPEVKPATTNIKKNNTPNNEFILGSMDIALGYTTKASCGPPLIASEKGTP